MNKKLLTAAVSVAFFAAPMMAQAEATFYGNLQFEQASVDDGATSVTTTGDNKRGRLGVKAEEDLGNGLKAFAKFEWQVDTTDASMVSGTRESNVGLSGGWGTFSAGSVKSPYKYWGGVTYDAFGTTLLEARSRGGLSGKQVDAGDAGGAFGHHGFIHNALSYQGKFGPVSVWGVTSLDEASTDGKGSDGDLILGGKFNMAGAEAFLVYASNDDGDALATYDGWTALKLGGSYKIAGIKLMMQYEMIEADPVGGGASDEATVIFLGGHYALGSTTLVLQIGQAEMDGAPETMDYMAAGAVHKLSKKTRVFAGYSTSEADVTSGFTAKDETILDVGLRVDF